MQKENARDFRYLFVVCTHGDSSTCNDLVVYSTLEKTSLTATMSDSKSFVSHLHPSSSRLDILIISNRDRTAKVLTHFLGFQ